MKLFLDENLSPQHAVEVRSNGGPSGAPDEEIRRFAIEDGRVLVTLDADFAHILRFPPEHTTGVVRLKVHPPTEQKIRHSIRRALGLLENTDWAAVVDDNKVRIRR